MSIKEEDITPDWNIDLENVIKKQGEQSETFYWLHNESSVWASWKNNIIQIPSIILASVTGFLSATSNILPPVATGGLVAICPRT